MFEKDGIVYAGEPVEGIKVSSAQSVGNGCLLVTFSTGETRLFDATELVGIPVYESFGNQELVADFVIDHGVLTWRDGEIDISPEAVYKRSYAYQKTA